MSLVVASTGGLRALGLQILDVDSWIQERGFMSGLYGFGGDFLVTGLQDLEFMIRA